MDVFHDTLLEDEVILWEGQPKQRLPRAYMALSIGPASTVIPFIFLGAVAGMAIGFVCPVPLDGALRALGGGLIGEGIVLGLGIRWVSHHLRDTFSPCYALTDKRVLLAGQEPGEHSVQALWLTDITRISRESDNDCTGTIRFHSANAVLAYEHIEGADAVYDLVEDLRAREASVPE